MATKFRRIMQPLAYWLLGWVLPIGIVGIGISYGIRGCNEDAVNRLASARIATQPHICSDRYLDATAQALATQRANELHTAAPGATAGPVGPVAQAVLVTAKRWPTGATLRVRNLDGTGAQFQQVLLGCAEWMRHANINFVASTDWTAEIRVSFSRLGAWSYVGTDALGQPYDQPTMNFGWLDSGTILHELGHALGLVHEHQSPVAGIPWDKPAVYAYYQGPPNFWTIATIDFNIFAKYAASQTQYTAWDQWSIMQYSIDDSLTIGQFQVGWNQVLSPTDIAFIRGVYPGRPLPVDPRIELNRAVLANLRTLLGAWPKPHPVAWTREAGTPDANGDGFADMSMLIGLRIARSRIQVWAVTFDGLSPAGAIIGSPQTVGIIPEQ